MSPETFVRTALIPGLSLLPAAMDTPEARSMIVAVCLQETGLAKRRQLGGGTARGYAQFEPVGVRGVLKHQASGARLREVCTALDISGTYQAIHRALEFHDPLTVCCARLLLRTLPAPLPTAEQDAVAWEQYLDAWRPGRPRPETWGVNFSVAWELIQGAA
jgi:hypothetical protein